MSHKKVNSSVKRLKHQLLKARENNKNGGDWFNAFMQIEDTMLEHKLWGFADITSNNPADTLINAINRLVKQRDALLADNLIRREKELEYIRHLDWISKNNGEHPTTIKNVATEGLAVEQSIPDISKPALLMEKTWISELKARVEKDPDFDFKSWLVNKEQSLSEALKDIRENPVIDVIKEIKTDRTEELYQKLNQWCENLGGDIVPPLHFIEYFETVCSEMKLNVQDLHIMKNVAVRLMNEHKHVHYAHNLAHHLYLKPFQTYTEEPSI